MTLALADLPGADLLRPDARPAALRGRRAKIVATVGPASRSEAMLRRLFLAGVDTFRLNFSHGSHEDHREVVARLRALEAEMGQPIGILQDLQGPKIRLGRLEGGERAVDVGERIVLRLAVTCPAAEGVPLPHAEIFAAVAVGHALLVDDGRIRLEVTGHGPDRIEAVVQAGGRLLDRKGVNLPDTVVDLPALTEKDRADLELGLLLGVDWVALSFVQRPEDLELARRLIAGRAGLVAKIEKPSALEHLPAIVERCDAVMVARGDLGVEIPPEDVPGRQKEIIRLCRRLNRPVIVATQMLESMTAAPTPTRAEASDVATAIYDGADAVMLSAESASGRFPEEAVTMMDRIIRRSEAHPFYAPSLLASAPDTVSAADAIAAAAVEIAGTIAAPALVAFSSSGRTGMRLAAQRPLRPILLLTASAAIARRLALVWGVRSLCQPDIRDHDEVAAVAGRAAHELGLGRTADRIVVVCGFPFGVSGTTNSVRVIPVGAGGGTDGP